MSEVNVTINGRVYGIACDEGQQQRVLDLAKYVDARLREIAQAGAASNEAHLLVLTSIIMADEVFDLKEGRDSNRRSSEPLGVRMSEEDETAIVGAIDRLAGRIDSIAGNIHKL